MGVIERISRRATTTHSHNVLGVLGRPDHETHAEHRPTETLERKPSGRVGSPALPGNQRKERRHR